MRNGLAEEAGRRKILDEHWIFVYAARRRGDEVAGVTLDSRGLSAETA